MENVALILGIIEFATVTIVVIVLSIFIYKLLTNYAFILGCSGVVMAGVLLTTIIVAAILFEAFLIRHTVLELFKNNKGIIFPWFWIVPG